MGSVAVAAVASATLAVAAASGVGTPRAATLDVPGPAPCRALVVDAAAGLLVLRRGRTVIVFRPRDGRSATVPVTDRALPKVELERSGLFYAYGRTVAFLPRTDVLRRLR